MTVPRSGWSNRSSGWTNSCQSAETAIRRLGLITEEDGDLRPAREFDAVKYFDAGAQPDLGDLLSWRHDRGDVTNQICSRNGGRVFVDLPKGGFVVGHRLIVPRARDKRPQRTPAASINLDAPRCHRVSFVDDQGTLAAARAVVRDVRHDPAACLQ